MRLFLVRHGEAKHPIDDAARPLTDAGRRVVERVAAQVARVGVAVLQIQHSGKLRAEQTAEIFAFHLAPESGVVAVSGLAPGDDVAPVAEALCHEPESLMLVGHLPFVGLLASHLLAGSRDRVNLLFGTATCACLLRTGGQWSLEWIITPALTPE